MGFLTDIRSGKRDQDGLGGYAVIFWICAGCIAGGGLGVYLAGGLEKGAFAFALAGAVSGGCVGFYAAFSKSALARVLALPGALVATIEVLAGL